MGHQFSSVSDTMFYKKLMGKHALFYNCIFFFFLYCLFNIRLMVEGCHLTLKMNKEEGSEWRPGSRVIHTQKHIYIYL